MLNQRTNKWYRYSRRVPPSEVLKKDVEHFILQPACIEDQRAQEGFTKKGLTELIDLADNDYVRLS